MYSRYFGFDERPFKLVPNPAYLFLSQSHEDVMAHLTYAVSHGDGFVEITGEVGTGKTTLCRVFLENLDSETEAAYVFNPKLDAVQLLKTINKEFCIDARADNCKDLIDTLNVFLMDQRSAARKVILIIDEAQNLEAEVLEQLRLLSNLETTQNKLLQIILVGQPELSEMLNSYELRQLGQRISLSCSLAPLTLAETRAYIRHRVQIASRKADDLFSSSAVRAIHRYSGGIPRLINIACDRSLLIAFSRNRRKISGRIANAATRELTQIGPAKPWRQRMPLVFSLVIVGLAVIALLFYFSVNGNRPNRSPERYKVSQSPGDKTAAIATPPPLKAAGEAMDKDSQPIVRDAWALPKPVFEVPAENRTNGSGELREPSSTVGSLYDLLTGLEVNLSRRTAAQDLLELWQRTDLIPSYLDRLDDTNEFIRQVGKQNGLQSHLVKGDLEKVKRLNLPAILVFNLPGREAQGCLALREIVGQDIFLTSGEDTLILADPAELEAYYAKTAFVFWQNFMALDGVIPLSSSDGSILSLKMLLQEIGFNDLKIDKRYDFKTQQAVRSIQSRNGLKADGYVGPLTKIILYNEHTRLPIPRLARRG